MGRHRGIQPTSTSGLLSGEEYRQALRKGLENTSLARHIRSLPWGSGSGFARAGEERGFVFCARVGDHPRAVFRFVPVDPVGSVGTDDAGEPEVIRDTLASLARAATTQETIRELSEETHRAAYGAWATARRDIYLRWQESTDPAALAPKVPKAMREAAAIVRDSPPPGMSQEAVNNLLDTIEAPYGKRFQDLFRNAMREHERPPEKVSAIADLVVELGLEKTTPPEPLPVISVEDVHLVCWQAIVPAPS